MRPPVVGAGAAGFGAAFFAVQACLWVGALRGRSAGADVPVALYQAAVLSALNAASFAFGCAWSAAWRAQTPRRAALRGACLGAPAALSVWLGLFFLPGLAASALAALWARSAKN